VNHLAHIYQRILKLRFFRIKICPGPSKPALAQINSCAAKAKKSLAMKNAPAYTEFTSIEANTSQTHLDIDEHQYFSARDWSN
jgi:hypothetical protein